VDPRSFGNRDLCGQVRRTSEAVDAKTATGGQFRSPKSAKTNDPRAQQRRYRNIVEAIG
jgi:hypothetical protein